VVVEIGTQVCDDAMGQPVAMHELIQIVDTLSSFGQVTSLTSIHLVNLSMATKTMLNRLGAVGRGPIMSSPQQANGQVGGMVTNL
jgi:hypothetical protein